MIHIPTPIKLLTFYSWTMSPLKILPGSHKGQLYSLWHDGQFTGVIDDAETQHFEANATECYGPARSLCLMHVCVAHASGVYRTFGPRTLYYAAADAVPLWPLAVPSINAGRLVRGVEHNSIPSTTFNLETPDVPKGASFLYNRLAEVRVFT